MDENDVEVEVDEFLNFQEPRPIARLEGMRGELLKIEKSSLDSKARREQAKEKVQDRLDGMASLAMDALEMALQSEDEGIRMKAVAMYMDRRAPRMGVDRSADEEVIEILPSKKLVADEVELLIKKMLGEGKS